jgi:hypothetical protein
MVLLNEELDDQTVCRRGKYKLQDCPGCWDVVAAEKEGVLPLKGLQINSIVDAAGCK